MKLVREMIVAAIAAAIHDVTDALGAEEGGVTGDFRAADEQVIGDRGAVAAEVVDLDTERDSSNAHQ